MNIHIDFKSDLSDILAVSEVVQFPAILVKALYAAAPDGTRGITLKCEKVGKNLYNGSVHFCDIKGVGYSKSIGNLISTTTPVLQLADLAINLIESHS